MCRTSSRLGEKNIEARSFFFFFFRKPKTCQIKLTALYVYQLYIFKCRDSFPFEDAELFETLLTVLMLETTQHC